MENENKGLTIAPQQASQSIIDAAKKESYGFMNPETWRTMQLVAQTFIQSGAMPKSMDTAPKLMVALQAGRESGLQPLESVNSFYFVNGKVSLYGEMAISQVIRCGHKIIWGKCNAESATVKIVRGDGGGEFENTFTLEEAKKKGIYKNVWITWPENMLRFKAFHGCARFICPDALHGVPIKELEEAAVEEIKQVDEKELNSNGLSPKTCRVIDHVVKEGVSLEEAISKEEPKVEVMPPAEKKPAKKSKAAEIMEKAKEDSVKKIQEEKGLWPEEVCAYLEFIKGIPDTDLKADIIQLKADSNGTFKGYDAYPSLSQEIKNLNGAQAQ